MIEKTDDMSSEFDHFLINLKKSGRPQKSQKTYLFKLKKKLKLLILHINHIFEFICGEKEKLTNINDFFDLIATIFKFYRNRMDSRLLKTSLRLANTRVPRRIFDLPKICIFYVFSTSFFPLGSFC